MNTQNASPSSSRVALHYGSPHVCSCGSWRRTLLFGKNLCVDCNSPRDLLQGKVIAGEYRLLFCLASGGMGSVYLAECLGTKERFYRAIKIANPELLHEQKIREQYIREFQITQMLGGKSKHLPSAFGEVGFEKEVGFYFALEYFHGETLSSLLRRTPSGLPLNRALQIAQQICKGMHTIHQAGVLHRDLKPQNIFLTQNQEGQELVKILDFGISIQIDTQEENLNGLLGTPVYMAPERFCEAEYKPDERSDIYSLGVLLYQVLTRKLPFFQRENDGLLSLMKAHCFEPVPPFGACQSQIPRALEQIVRKMLAKRPEERFQTMESVDNALMCIHLEDGYKARTGANPEMVLLDTKEAPLLFATERQIFTRDLRSPAGTMQREAWPSTLQAASTAPDGLAERHEDAFSTTGLFNWDPLHPTVVMNAYVTNREEQTLALP